MVKNYWLEILWQAATRRSIIIPSCPRFSSARVTLVSLWCLCLSISIKKKTIKKTKTGKDKPRSKCEGNSGEFVELVPEKLNYLGPKDLTQYFIRSKEMIDSLFVLLQANQHQPGYGRKHWSGSSSWKVSKFQKKFPNYIYVIEGDCWAPSSLCTSQPCSSSSSRTWPTTSSPSSSKPSSPSTWLSCWWVSCQWLNLIFLTEY